MILSLLSFINLYFQEVFIMNKHLRRTALFLTGTSVGFVLGGATVIKAAISSDDVRKFVKWRIQNKINDVLNGERLKKKHIDLYHGPNEIQFDSYDDAFKARDLIVECITLYGCITVCDIKDIIGIKNTHYRGWDDPTVFTTFRYGCRLKFPAAKNLTTSEDERRDKE